MLIVEDVSLIDSKHLNVSKRKHKKTQIFLYDTQRRTEDFISKIKFRRNGKFDDIPHFIITKIGTIIQLFDTNHSSVTFGQSNLDNKLIKIAIENLGWLNKNTITGFLNNWIGDPYRAEPYIRGWRDRYFWDRYSEQQMESLNELCDHLCEKHNIPKQVVPSQGYLENVSKFSGIVCKSNYSNIYTDINPSFNFKIFLKNEK
jgi:N-acetyl-anhydromuramyl-L-alanine amidase AmpD